MYLRLLFIIVTILNCDAQINMSRRLSRLQLPQIWRRRIQNFSKRTGSVCYETLGCFDMPNKRSPLKRLPDSPTAIDTKFFLFRRNLNFSHPQILRYEDEGLSLNQSNFNSQEPVKVIIHGYLGRWNEQGALESVHAYLKICACNILLLDWEKGAQGPQYANAASNTEIVGRQLGILLLHMVNKGVKASNIHLIGFSLGAHVAGCASEVLKQKGHLLGRITGLDAASPLFRHNHFREKSKKLDKGDAKFVDAIHTDASPFFTEGFGLLEPYGHVDYFPNGGFEQPGCSDGMASVVLTHFEGSITRDVACSHIRAWKLFLETLNQKLFQDNKCEFTAYKCKGGLGSFLKGDCFPQNGQNGDSLTLDPVYRTELGKLGVDAIGDGVMYLVTKGGPSFCGLQLQVSIVLSQGSPFPKGNIEIIVQHSNTTTNFEIPYKIQNYVRNRREINGLGITASNEFNPELKTIMASISYQLIEVNENSEPSAEIYFDQVTVRDIYGHSWQNCKKGLAVLNWNTTLIKLHQESC